MSQEFVTPNLQSIASLLHMFLGEGLTVSDSDSTDLADRFVATYINDDNDLVALCACDYAFVARAGAALSLLPADVATEAIAQRKITDVMIGNFHEVMNICSKLLMSDSSTHLRLDKTITPEQSGEPISKLQERSGQISAFDVCISGYGDGSLAFLTS